MWTFDSELEQLLETIRQHGLYRKLCRIDSAQGPRIEIGGRKLISFASNDYLGLSSHPTIKEAAIRAVEKFGAGSGAARLLSGSLAPHHELEEALAAFKHTEAALSFSSGYTAASGAICALLDKHDVIVLDKLVHACIVDAAKLSGAKIRVFKHNDLNDLEAILKWANGKRAAGISSVGKNSSTLQIRSPQRVLVVTESVFSMDGDCAPLREIVELKDRYNAWLMVDEAHATGVFGPGGAGLIEELGLTERVEIQMVTLGKALGAAGGAICGSRKLIDLLVNRARSFIYSTAPVPAAAAAAAAAVKLVQSEIGARLRRTLWQRIAELKSEIPDPNSEMSSAIIPVMIGEEARAVQLSIKLFEGGFYIPAVRYPTVPRGKARLRISLTAAHDPQDVVSLSGALKELLGRDIRRENL